MGGVYTDGSMDEKDNMEGSWYVEGGEVEDKVALGRVATVWDREISGIGGPDADALLNTILILFDS